MSALALALVVSLAAVAVLAVVLGVAVRRSHDRWLDEPTDLLPLLADLDDDPLERHFDEAARLLRGEADPDIAAIYDRRALHEHEAEFQTATIRRLTRRLERLPRT